MSHKPSTTRARTTPAPHPFIVTFLRRWLPAGVAGQLLGVLLLVTTLAVASLGFTAYRSQQRALENQVAHHLNSLSVLKQNEIETWLRERKADINLLAVNHLNQEHFSELFSPDVPTQRKEEFAAFLADNLLGLQRSRPGYLQISMTDWRGTVHISTDPGAVGSPLDEQAIFFDTLRAPNHQHIKDIYVNPRSGRVEMAFAHAIFAIDLHSKQETEDIIGIVVAIVDVDQTVFPLLGQLPEMGDTAETLLVRREGDTLRYLSDLQFHDGPPLSVTADKSSETLLAAWQAASGQSGVTQSLDYRGVPVLASYRQVGELGWGFVAKQDAVQAFAPVRSLAHRLILLATAVFLAVSGLAFFLAKRLVHPLQKLALATQQVAGGELDIDVRLQRQDEIGALAASFQRMIFSLKLRQRQTGYMTRSLEQLNATPDVLEAFQHIARDLQKLVGADSVCMSVLDESRTHFHLLALDPPNRMEPGRRAFAVADTAAATTILAGQPYILANLAQDCALGTEQAFYSLGFRSLIVLPLLAEQRVVGMLGVFSRTEGGLDATQIPLLSQVASALALALERSRLFQETQQRADDLERAFEELRRTDELKDAFIRNITHELKTPVATLAGYTELLMADDVGNLRLDQQEMLTVVADQSQHLIRLVNDVVAIRRLDNPVTDPTRLCLLDLLRGAVERARRRAADRALTALQIDLVLTGPSVANLSLLGNKDLLDRAFDNLLHNAIKFSPTGGAIQVVLSPACRDGELDEDAAPIAARISISDEGIGIPAGQLDAIWERFYQIDGSATRRFGGTGLGLALVREVVTAHQGTVWAESEHGAGTTIHMQLPLPAVEYLLPEPHAIPTTLCTA